MAKEKIIIESGKRKSAVAKAVLRSGSGNVIINGMSLDVFSPKISRERIKEAIILAGASAKNVNITVRTTGGGISGQADAARLAIAKALSEYDSSLKDVYLDYDRQLLVADVRRKEVSKPNSQGKARAKRQKSYR